MSQTFEATLSCKNNPSVTGTSSQMVGGGGESLGFMFSYTILDKFIINNIREEFVKRTFLSLDKCTPHNTTCIYCQKNFILVLTVKTFLLLKAEEK